MSIKVVFPLGQDTATVGGLFQWDYGKILEIESEDIGSEIMEVHFACTNMSEAIVRPCSFSNGIGTVTIPDQCLEQATPITAWIYRIVGTSGYTVKTIILPIKGRKRPSMTREVPQEITNKYTELITEINEAVENLESGNVTVEKARNAETANHAATAGNASSATYATTAGRATEADKAKNADDALRADYAGSAAAAGIATSAKYAEEAETADRATLADRATTAVSADYIDLSTSNLVFTDTNAYEITIPGVYVVLLRSESSALFCSTIALAELDCYVKTEYVEYGSGYLRPSQYAGNIVRVFRLAKFIVAG